MEFEYSEPGELVKIHPIARTGVRNCFMVFLFLFCFVFFCKQFVMMLSLLFIHWCILLSFHYFTRLLDPELYCPLNQANYGPVMQFFEGLQGCPRHPACLNFIVSKFVNASSGQQKR